MALKMDTERMFSWYKAFPQHVAAQVVFNEMMLTEFEACLTTDVIDDFVMQHPHVRLNGHGAQELCEPNRAHIVQHLIKRDLLLPSAEIIFQCAGCSMR